MKTRQEIYKWMKSQEWVKEFEKEIIRNLGYDLRFYLLQEEKDEYRTLFSKMVDMTEDKWSKAMNDFHRFAFR